MIGLRGKVTDASSSTLGVFVICDRSDRLRRLASGRLILALVSALLAERGDACENAVAVTSQRAVRLLSSAETALAAGDSKRALKLLRPLHDQTLGENWLLDDLERRFNGLWATASMRVGGATAVDEAIGTLRSLLTADRKNPWLRSRLGEALSRTPRGASEARRILEELAKLDLVVDAEGYAALARLRLAAADASGAQAALARCQLMTQRPALCNSRPLITPNDMRQSPSEEAGLDDHQPANAAPDSDDSLPADPELLYSGFASSGRRTRSGKVKTESLFPEVLVCANGNGMTMLQAVLGIGPDGSRGVAELDPDERLAIEQGTVTQMLGEGGSTLTARGILSPHYTGSIIGATPGTPYGFALLRKGNVRIAASRTILPAPVSFLAPKPDSAASRSRPLEIEWPPGDGGDVIDMAIIGDCVKSVRKLALPDRGQTVIRPHELRPVGASHKARCVLTIVLARRHIGTLDPSFARGGSFWGIQLRTLEIFSTP